MSFLSLIHILEFVPDRPGMRIADIGCGTGGQTITIARNRDCTITAVDLLPELLEEFRTRIKKAGLENRVTAIQGSMDALPFSPGEFDVIWAEGSIYNIGFERGLREWRQYLKPGGIIAVTECSWLSGARLASKFISDYFPDIDSPSGKVRILEEAGYAPLAHFALPEHCWTENYFAHASARIPGSVSYTHLNPMGVAVVIEASHMCMQMRGIEKQQSATTTSAFTGIFLSDHRTREEFMTLISHRYR